MPNSTQNLLSDQSDPVIVSRVHELLQSRNRVLIAIDGMCCAGKTTMTERLGELLDANVFHLDDYFLQPHSRTPGRLNQPGGNVDVERFLSETLLPALRGETAQVRKYDCHKDRVLPPVAISPKKVILVEGAYSLHPLLAPYYDLKVFCRIDPQLQLQRILKRNGKAALKVFESRWIPLENKYFEALDIISQCDIIIDSVQDNNLE
ncbi:MAG: uridine kinase [Firmicutes bacterium HGW-Firmicutes-9]|jgi:uridine kinase|nr:MAG: uridine kinase [Firmicutes bacterium HGW-Firmicutes-9]